MDVPYDLFLSVLTFVERDLEKFFDNFKGEGGNRKPDRIQSDFISRRSPKTTIRKERLLLSQKRKKEAHQQ